MPNRPSLFLLIAPFLAAPAAAGAQRLERTPAPLRDGASSSRMPKTGTLRTTTRQNSTFTSCAPTCDGRPGRAPLCGLHPGHGQVRRVRHRGIDRGEPRGHGQEW